MNFNLTQKKFYDQSAIRFFLITTQKNLSYSKIKITHIKNMRPKKIQPQVKCIKKHKKRPTKPLKVDLFYCIKLLPTLLFTSISGTLGPFNAFLILSNGLFLSKILVCCG